MSDLEKLQRAKRARDLLEDETLKDAIQEAEAQIIADWKNAPSMELRELIHSRLKGLDYLLSHLRIFADEGTYLEEKERLSKL